MMFDLFSHWISLEEALRLVKGAGSNPVPGYTDDMDVNCQNRPGQSKTLVSNISIIGAVVYASKTDNNRRKNISAEEIVNILDIKVGRSFRHERRRSVAFRASCKTETEKSIRQHSLKQL